VSGGVVAASAVVIVAVVVGPWIRLPLDATFRRVFGRWAAAVVVVAVAWAVAVAVVAITAPVVMLPAAVLAVGLWMAATWRARRLQSGRHGRPPGSRSVTGSVRALAHRDAYQADERRYGPVFTASQFGRSVVCVVGIQRGQQLLRSHRDHLGPSPLPFTDQLIGGFLRYMDDDAHDVYGPAFRQAMSRQVTDAAMPVTQRSILHELSSVGFAPTHPGSAMGRIARDTLLMALFGVDSTTSQGADFTAAHRRFARRTLLGGHRRTTDALGDLRRLVDAQRQRLQTGEVSPACALGEFIHAPNDLPDAVVIDNLLFMLRIGTQNLQGLLVWQMQLLAGNPSLRQRLGSVASGTPVASGAQGGPGSALPTDAFVLESLRMAQSEYLYRRVLNDIDLNGFRLRRGQLVRLCVWESHQDPEVFTDPQRCTDRFAHRRYPQHEFSAFGMDGHACNAVGLVMMVAQAVVQAVAADQDLHLNPSASLTRELRHWSHWRPGDDLTWSRNP
jgi:cytochrome P450